jgi:hypothetical protein
MIRMIQRIDTEKPPSWWFALEEERRTTAVGYAVVAAQPA